MKVIYNGRFFACAYCNQPISETILRNIAYCPSCGKSLNWNVWDKKKNELIKHDELKRTKQCKLEI